MSHNLEENNYAEACSSSESTVGENVYSAIARIALTEYDPADYPDLAYELDLMERYRAWVAECDASPDGWVEMPDVATIDSYNEFISFVNQIDIVELAESGDEPLPHRPTMMERYRAWVAECDASPDGWVEMPKGVTGFTDSVFFAFACKQMAHEPIESESESPVVDQSDLPQ